MERRFLLGYVGVSGAAFVLYSIRILSSTGIAFAGGICFYVWTKQINERGA